MKKNNYQTKDAWFYILMAVITVPPLFLFQSFREKQLLRIVLGLVVFGILIIRYRYLISSRTKVNETNDSETLNKLFKDLFKKRHFAEAYSAIEKMYDNGDSSIELNIMYLSIVPFMRTYSEADIKLLDSMIEYFYKMDKQEKMKHALIPYIRGYYYHSIGSKEMAEDYKSETYEAEPYFDSKYPEYINNLKY